MRQNILSSDFPKDRLINSSAFGGTIKEVISVIETLDDVVDMHEINGSCPHSEKGGMIIGIDPQSVYDFTKAAVQVTKKPVLFKLTPNTDKIGLLARAVKDAGGAGIVAINTVGPYIHYIDGHPVLTSKVGGGKSGLGIKQRGLECVREVCNAVPDKDFLMIVMGGIGTARDINDYYKASGNKKKVVYGIGTRLIGMTEEEMANYFFTLVFDIENGTNFAEELLKKPDMSYKKVKVEEIINNNCEFKVYRTNRSINAKPGQMVFAWIPGIGEKPFSIMDDNPLTLGVLERGYFTKHFNSMKRGEEFYIRGPYGQDIDVPIGSDVVLVGGGCGIAGLFLPAKILSRKTNIISYLGAKDAEHLPYLEQFKKYGEVKVATEDGSLGIKGTVADLFNNINLNPEKYFINCGPRAMVNSVLPIEMHISDRERIYYSVDEITRCGVGICGSCVNENGLRTCVEGPFLNPL